MLNLIWLLVLCVLHESSFISAQFFVLNLVGWFGVLSKNFIIFWYSIIILYNWSQIINIFLSSFWKYMSCFRYFFIILICNFLWIIFWFFDISLLYYFNLSSSIISCHSSGDTHLSLGVSLSSSFVTVSELFCCEFFKTFVILLVILLSIKSSVASAVFWVTLFKQF